MLGCQELFLLWVQLHLHPNKQVPLLLEQKQQLEELLGHLPQELQAQVFKVEQ